MCKISAVLIEWLLYARTKERVQIGAFRSFEPLRFIISTNQSELCTLNSELYHKQFMVIELYSTAIR